MLVHLWGLGFEIHSFLRIIGYVFEIVRIAPAPWGGCESQVGGGSPLPPEGGKEEKLRRKTLRKIKQIIFILFAKFGAIWNAKVVRD